MKEKMTRASLDIVIVDYNAGDFLRECLRSIAAHPPEYVEIRKVIVIDNASSVPSEKSLEGLDLPLLLIKNEVNRGFSAACNQGARAGDARYILFLNPDTRLLPGSLDAPAKFLDRPENAAYGIAGIQLLEDDGRINRSCSRLITPKYILNSCLGLDRVLPHRFSSGRMDDWDHAASREVDEVMGAFLFVFRSLFEELDGFDERFFVYYEEVDLCLRARKSGRRVYYLTEAQAFHTGCATSDRVKAHRLFYSLRSRIRYAYKNFGAGGGTMVLVGSMAIEPITRLLNIILRRDWESFPDLVNAYRMMWRALPATLKPASAMSGRSDGRVSERRDDREM